MTTQIRERTKTDFNELTDDETLRKTIQALKTVGIDSIIAEDGEQAKTEALAMIPEGAEVMTMTSVTLETIGLTKEVNEIGRYDSVKNKLNKMDRQTQGREMQKLGAAPDYALGSVHAVTEDGKVLIASNTGSQLPAYVYGASHVIWVVGTQKIVRDEEQAKQRIWEYILPKESARARKAYGLPDTWNSYPSKILTVNREVTPGRLTVIFVKEALGF